LEYKGNDKMKLKHGKKYETADGSVYRVRKHTEYNDIWDVSDKKHEHWDENGCGFVGTPNLIRRHYTKPKPAHKLDLKPGDVVELVAWEDGHLGDIGLSKTIGINNVEIPSSYPKGERPLFRVVSRFSYPKPAS
jgi:hypothetical protein